MVDQIKGWIGDNITFGNILNIFALIVIAAGFYWTTTFQLKQHDVQITNIMIDTKEFRTKVLDSMERSRERDAVTDLRIIERLSALEAEMRGLRSDLLRLDGVKKP